jgi:hypothetical protein
VQPGIAAVQFEVRLASDGSSVTRGRSDRPTAGNLIITQSILPAVAYQVRGQFVPSTPRDMLWSGWIDVTTPDVRFSLAEFDAALTAQVTTIATALQDQVNDALNRIASVASDIAARAPLDKQELRSQLSARSARCARADRRRQDRRRDRRGGICLVLDGRNGNLRLDHRLCQPDRNRDRDL